jgi:D-alanine-D-alanine ligase
MQILIVHNAPSLDWRHADYASEAGVLDSVAAISEALVARGHRVRRLAIGGTVMPLFEAIGEPTWPDVVVNLCESFAGSSAGEAHFAALLELIGVPYTGSPPETLALARRKAATKWLLAGAGLPTADFRWVRRDEVIRPDEFQSLLAAGPLLVKPAEEDASLGIGAESVVTTPEQLLSQVRRVQARYGHVLVERYLDGREFNVAVLALPQPQVLPLAEIEFGRDADCPWPIVTYDAKWVPDSKGWQSTPVVCPASVESALADQIRRVALAAFQVTQCRDYARIDLRLASDGQVHVLEVNANPDLGPTAGFARALTAFGLDYGDFAERLVRHALART